MNTGRISRATWAVIAAAAVLMALSQGSRSALGLFLSPLNTATGLGLATISFGVALSQLAAGFAQPLLGALSDRHGPARIIAAGAIAMAGASAVVPFAGSSLGLTLALVASATASVAVGSAPTLLAAVGQRVSATQRGLASGLIGAGGSAGQLMLGPFSQTMIVATGWINAMLAVSALALIALPLARSFRAPATQSAPAVPSVDARGARIAFVSPSYWLVTASFFVCGFHVSFLLAHMPGVIESCGLPPALSGTWLAIIGLCNIVGSVASGVVVRHVSKKLALATLYALRAIGVAAFLVAPKTELAVVLFSIWIGLTYMATLPPTSGLIADLFGVRRLGTLLGVTMMVHQVGSFLGVWLGGIAFETTGSYDWMWKADIVLAGVAALCALGVRDRGCNEAARAAALLAARA